MAASLTRFKLRVLVKKFANRRAVRLLSNTNIRESDSTSEESSKKTTHFGFQTVTEEEKEEKGNSS